MRKPVSRVLTIALVVMLCGSLGGSALASPGSGGFENSNKTHKTYVKHQKKQQKKFKRDSKKQQKALKKQHEA